MTDKNLSIWNALGKTDPAHTKPFNRAGGFKGTAIKPQWVLQRLTEQFGPCGIGWGTGEPSFQVVSAGAETLVYCTVSAWHTDRANLFYGVGGDKVSAKRGDGSFNDDEAFKKAFTDAVMNAFKFIGVAADVHLGRFDDSKYVEEARKESSGPVRNPAKTAAAKKALADVVELDAAARWNEINAHVLADMHPDDLAEIEAVRKAREHTLRVMAATEARPSSMVNGAEGSAA